MKRSLRAAALSERSSEPIAARAERAVLREFDDTAGLAVQALPRRKLIAWQVAIGGDRPLSGLEQPLADRVQVAVALGDQLRSRVAHCLQVGGIDVVEGYVLVTDVGL
jgi:hypothetical protein